ncbi:MAG TPA: hypothetical protein VGF67_28435 [Ktedonobacteraceae bacterium]
MQNQRSFETIALTIADQRLHIERSEQLLGQAAPGSTPLLCWSQAEPEALVLGFSQQESLLNDGALQEERVPIYRRRAGGTAVLVGSDLLGLDVVLPEKHPLILADLVESYRWLGETWVYALHLLGIEARTIPPEEAHEQRLLAKREAEHRREAVLRRACYAANSSYEVVVGQRKVVGLDMIRRRNGSLLQAGVLLHWNCEKLARLLGHSPVEQELLRTTLPERAVGLDELTGRTVGAREVIEAFERALCSL